MAEGTTLFVGLDVHVKTIMVAVADGATLEVRGHGPIPNTPRSVAQLVKKLGPADRLRVCYEAGPCGYVLYRQLEELGVACTVVAPALIPRKPGERIKTDRKDALKLARLHRAGELTAVAAPSLEQEALRDLTRERQATQQDGQRVRQRIRTLLVRMGVREPRPGKRWSAVYREWLAALVVEEAQQQTVLAELRRGLAETEARLGRLTAAVEAEAKHGPFAEVITALTSIRGVGVVTAVTLVAEIGDPGRFDSPRQLMAWAGLVPSEHSSGGRERRGRITKTGNAHVRLVVVESAWHGRRKPHVSQELAKRQRGQTAVVKAIAWEAQVRMHKRYWVMVNGGKPTPKAAVGIGRELLGFIWAIAREVAHPGTMPAGARPAA